MKSRTNIPNNAPELGFYYHYKHDPEQGIRHHAYEVLGVGFDTENEEDYFVVYRVLYDNDWIYESKLYSLRPIEIFMSKVLVEGERHPRFQKIIDAKLIEELEKVKKQMYS